MKKIMMTLGFAAVTVLAVQAQETQTQQEPQTQPQEQVEPQTDPQEQTLPDNQEQFPQEDPAMEQESETQQQLPQENPEVQEQQQEQPVPQEAPEMETEPAQESPDMQTEPAQEAPDSLQNQSGMMEGMSKITESDLPQEVKDGIEDSEYQGATIEQAYELSGDALTQVLTQNNNTTGTLATGEPEKLYQLQINTQDSKSAVLYFTEEGELYAEKEM